MTVPHAPRRGQFLIALSLTLGAFLALASRRLPCEPASGLSLNGEFELKQADPPVSPARLRIATFNIHSGVGADRRFDLGRIADALHEFDFVGLNEVRGPRPWCPDQAEQLGMQLHRQWLFAPFERRWFREDFGNGVLSRYPVSHWKRTPLPCTTRKGHGNVLELTLETKPKPICILVTHIDRQADHDVQLKTVIERFLEVPSPAILMGDLNSTRDDPQIVKLLRSPGIQEAAPRNTEGRETSRIDWIFARGLRPRFGEIRSGEISDHPLVLAEFEFSMLGRDDCAVPPIEPKVSPAASASSRLKPTSPESDQALPEQYGSKAPILDPVVENQTSGFRKNGLPCITCTPADKP